MLCTVNVRHERARNLSSPGQKYGMAFRDSKIIIIDPTESHKWYVDSSSVKSKTSWKITQDGHLVS